MLVTAEVGSLYLTFPYELGLNDIKEALDID